MHNFTIHQYRESLANQLSSLKKYLRAAEQMIYENEPDMALFVIKEGLEKHFYNPELLLLRAKVYQIKGLYTFAWKDINEVRFRVPELGYRALSRFSYEICDLCTCQVVLRKMWKNKWFTHAECQLVCILFWDEQFGFDDLIYWLGVWKGNHAFQLYSVFIQAFFFTNTGEFDKALPLWAFLMNFQYFELIHCVRTGLRNCLEAHEQTKTLANIVNDEFERDADFFDLSAFRNHKMFELLTTNFSSPEKVGNISDLSFLELPF
jgi:hypothetical protein